MRRWVLPLGLGMTALLAAAWTSGHLAGVNALEALGRESQSVASLHAALLRTELEKYRSLPSVMGHDPDVAASLRMGDPRTREDIDHEAMLPLNQKLETLSAETRAEAIYVINGHGLTIAASKWNDNPPAFVGCACGDREYFIQAMRTGSGEYFSKGRSARAVPGLYISHAVHGDGVPLGVAVVKVAFADLEREWRAAGRPSFITDANGVVIITSVPEWRFKTIKPLSAQARATLSAALGQFREEKLEPLSASGLDQPGTLAHVSAQLPGEGAKQSFLVSRTQVEGLNWTLHVLEPEAAPVLRAQLQAGAIAFLSGLLLLGGVVFMLLRYEARRVEAERQAAAREELEVQVTERTADLREANHRLVSEMDERKRMEINLHRLQDDLVQANKLTILGQIAAGVAHEINQPVAAIRTYAENTGLLLERNQPDMAAKNLGIIGGLTERITTITDELRAFARRSNRKDGVAAVTEAIDGALLLVSHRLRNRSVSLLRRGEDPGLSVCAERVRVEQVLVNLLQNALDAIAGRPDAEIEILVTELAEMVCITVSDNGVGLSADAQQTLFMPFVTSKAQGLGLGLVICRDIAAELGGDLTLQPSAQGASFMFTLRKAA
jgi:two-component system C4-dicarboxylate transport sensor histidine kinase DctB